MKTLYLLTNSFPYGDWEPYLETEIKYYDNFDEVYIFALQIRKEHLKRKRTVGNNVKVIPIMKASNKTYLLYSFRTLTDINLYKEFARQVKSRRLSVRNFVNMFVYFSRSHYSKRSASLRASSGGKALYNEAGEWVFRLSVTRTIFSVRGYRVSEVYRRISAKSNAVRVCVTTVSLLPARGSEIMKTSATPLRTYTESTFSGWPGSQGIRVSFMSCLFVSSMQTTGRRGSYGR